MSAVAIMENWKVAVSKEMAVAAQFDENWGFLKASEQETKVVQMECTGFRALCRLIDFLNLQPRPFETRLVKYWEHGKPTVKDKRIPLTSEDHGSTPRTPDTVKKFPIPLPNDFVFYELFDEHTPQFSPSR